MFLRSASTRALIAAIAFIGAGFTAACQPATPPALPVSAPASAASHAFTNLLAREKSPYLLQHQHNPVDWHPWGTEAFARAKAENKPIFLSIGYSTCHWCHVMERESFESEETAKVLNRHFVSIKVDREERPDVDKIYMTYVQARTGGGGWPLNVFLTPDLQPFYGGTYWPPERRHGRPSFTEVLTQIAGVWSERRGEVLEAARDMTERLRLHTEQAVPTESAPLSPAVLAHAASVLMEDYDPRHGGFGGAPKFPRPSQPAFLLRHALRTGDTNAIAKVLHTCDRMAAGGMRDQLGGGFARYSVDAQWLVPHFEKMLYDNAQLVHLYLDAHLVDGEGRHAEVVRSTLEYVVRDMTHRDGGFYSAEDADSEGQEGKFYCWTLAELKKLLTPEELAVVVRHFGITEKGNFEDHSHPAPLKNLNVLSIADPSLSRAEAGILATA
ncbi:MAG: thioredoxin domain-containing protein, partial [Limisphaerales bacterium]